MFEQSQATREPLGLTVFGSAVVRVEPDFGAILFSVSKTAKHPRDAFAGVRKDAGKISKYLAREKVSDVHASRVALDQDFRFADGKKQREGYSAKIGFNVILRELDRVAEVLSGLIDAGANRVERVSFGTSDLRSLRAEARRRAVGAARGKAELYASAAGVVLGNVIDIRDINPAFMSGRGEGYVGGEVDSDDVVSGPIDPGAILVGGAVRMSFAIVDDSTNS